VLLLLLHVRGCRMYVGPAIGGRVLAAAATLPRCAGWFEWMVLVFVCGLVLVAGELGHTHVLCGLFWRQVELLSRLALRAIGGRILWSGPVQD
jgi:hypothetical protein